MHINDSKQGQSPGSHMMPAVIFFSPGYLMTSVTWYRPKKKTHMDVAQIFPKPNSAQALH